MQKNTAEILIEALPYIQRFSKKNIVVKVGGAVLDDKYIQKRIVEDIVLLKQVGVNVILVHGGGKEISDLLGRLGKESKFVNGLRVTDGETMEITQMVLAGLINKDLAANIAKFGGKAVGVSGKDGNLINAKKLKVTKKLDYGYVGEINAVDTEIIRVLEKNNYIPVISSIASDYKGNTLNVNADTAAMEIAIDMKAEKLIFLTDMDGVLKDVKNPTSLIREIKLNKITSLIRSKDIAGGMIPKIKASANAIKKGVGSVHILNGKREHSILLELFTDLGIGTKIFK